jgi:hypothetical protein
MARPKGALNKKTRRALYDAAQEYDDHGKSAINYLAKIMLDTQKDDAIRMRAADILLPFVRPKLSAVEQTNIDPALATSEGELIAQLRGLADNDPALAPIIEAYLKQHFGESDKVGVEAA